MDDVRVTKRLRDKKFSLQYAVFMRGEGSPIERFPEDGYAQATMRQLADLASIGSVPSHLINERIEAIYKRIEEIAKRLNSVIETGRKEKIADALGLIDHAAAMRVCVCIWLDSFLAQERLSDVGSRFNGLAQFTEVSNGQLREQVHLSWKHILDVNYTAIFLPARDTIAELSSAVGSYLRAILEVANDVVQDSMHHILDIGGELLPRLAPDRKETAAFYTLRESADLLAALVPESCYQELVRQQSHRKPGLVGDFACGTGSLLVSAYRRIRRHIDAAGDLPDTKHQ